MCLEGVQRQEARGTQEAWPGLPRDSQKGLLYGRRGLEAAEGAQDTYTNLGCTRTLQGTFREESFGQIVDPPIIRTMGNKPPGHETSDNSLHPVVSGPSPATLVKTLNLSGSQLAYL